MRLMPGMVGSPTHYDDSYFAWQRAAGECGRILDGWKFQPFLGPDDVVLDFGCGGGYTLGVLPCRARYGIEVNPAARREAAKLVRVFASVEELPRDVLFDVIISHHVLEHVDYPLQVLEQLRERLKPGGRVVFVVPAEDWRRQPKYQAEDINQHLYTWTPLSLGNLFVRAGFDLERVELLRHAWLPKAGRLCRLMPPWCFHQLCHLWGVLTARRQIRIVARNLPS